MNDTELASHLHASFAPFFDAPVTVWRSLAEHGVVQVFPKGTVLKEAGAMERHLRFIVEGGGGILFWNGSDHVCTDLCMTGEFLHDHGSLISGCASPLEVVLFKRSTVLTVPKEKLDDLLSRSPLGMAIMRAAAEALFIQKHGQQLEVLSLTAEERYHRMVKERKDLLLNIPQRHIASYLGIRPESLSRIRRKKP